MHKTFYLTTPLYYVNAKPHIGHAYTNILADTFSRFQRFLGKPSFLLTGTDEHGTKVEKSAREKQMGPKDYVDSMVPQFNDLWKLLGIEYDYFIRTTDEDHKRIVQKILKELEAKSDIYKASYQGWYCTPCESFWTELQLDQGKCPDCKREVQQLSEENYFFKLAKYQAWLIDYIQKHEDFISPTLRKNEILGFLRQPLDDLSITRPRSRLAWGIDYPHSKGHVVYVWFDALINYISAVGYGEKKEFNQFWPADLHLVGKDILRQHAVYWPIMLKALDLEMPKKVLAHGWWMMSGAKVSKSRGNAVDPVELVQKYGVDALRYFLLREVTLGQDGAFSEDLLRERYTTDLANDLGNVWFRFAAMLEKYFEGKVPEGEIASDPLTEKTFELWDQVLAAMGQYDPKEALNEIFEIIRKANQFVEENKPWVLAKDPAQKTRLAAVLKILGECLAHIVFLLQPFMPETSAKVLERLKIPASFKISDASSFKKPFLKAGTLIEKGTVLFPKLEEEDIKP